MIRIVLTNTDDLLLKLNTSLFSREGFLINSASTGKDILHMTASNPPDIVFMNIDLPDMSSAACCMALKTNEQTRHIPVITCAPLGRELDTKLLLHVGCDAVISSPIVCKDFVAATSKFIKISERAMYRLPVRLPVRYGTNLPRLQTGCSINLNTTGLFLETNDFVAPGTSLEVEFLLPGSERTICCSARVSWVNGSTRSRLNLSPGMGLRFVDINREDTDLIASFMSERLKESGLKIGKFNVLQWSDS